MLPALAVVFAVWLFYGRERKTGYDREYEQAPPFDTEPALVPPLLRQEKEPGSNEFTATLFDLIRRGRYKATPVTTERKIWAGLRHEDVADLEVTAGRRDDASDGTSSSPSPSVVDAVIGTRAASACRSSATAIEEDRAGQSKRFTSFKDTVAETIDKRGLVR